MAKVRYTMRFYRAHDLDLITFIETHEFNIMHAVYSALNAFVGGDVFVIEIPPERHVAGEYQRVYNRALILDDKKDADAVALLSTVMPGYRNSFLKNLLRLYLCCPFSEEYFLSREGAEKAIEMTEVFRKNRRTAQAGTIRKKEKKGREKEEKRESESKKEASATESEETEKKAEIKAESKNDTGADEKTKEKENELKTKIGNSVPGRAVNPESYFSAFDDEESEEESEPEDINDLFNDIMGTGF